jgi:predicted nucleic acid-binding protein
MAEVNLAAALGCGGCCLWCLDALNRVIPSETIYTINNNKKEGEAEAISLTLGTKAQFLCSYEYVGREI